MLNRRPETGLTAEGVLAEVNTTEVTKNEEQDQKPRLKKVFRAIIWMLFGFLLYQMCVATINGVHKDSSLNLEMLVAGCSSIVLSCTCCCFLQDVLFLV